jgi:hypothetical protein
VFEWTTRTGHTYTRHPDPVPTAGWDHTELGIDDLTPTQTPEDFVEMLDALTRA